MRKLRVEALISRLFGALALITIAQASWASLIIPNSVGVNNFTGGGSGVPYPVVYNLTASSVQYNDRTTTFTAPLPNSWTDAEYIQTSNNDKSVTYTASFLSFAVQQASTIYIALDTRITGTSIPGWLTSGYTNTGVVVSASGGTYALYRNKTDAPANSVVTLGSNTVNPCTSCSMYSVIAVPATASLVQNLVVKNSSGTYPICGVGGATCGSFDNFYTGTLLYSDRTYTLNAPPSSVSEFTFIQTANSDKSLDLNNNTGYMTFNVAQKSFVYVAFDSAHISPIPGWLSGSGAIFSDTGTTISAGGGGPTLELYKSKTAYAAGAQVNLGSNEVTSFASASMYSVIVVPVAGSTMTAPTLSSTPICNNARVVGLSWTPATDNIGVQYYQILKNGAVVGTVSGDQTAFQDNSARTPGTSYNYSIAAHDSLAVSATSNVVGFGTPAAAANGDSPYCPSTFITSFAPTPGSWGTSMTYADGNGQRALADGPPYDDGSDIWPVTWGADNKSYVAFGDGWGLCGAMDTNGDTDLTSFGFGVIDTSISQWVKESGTNKCYTSMENGGGFLNGNIYGGFNHTHGASVNGKTNSVIAIAAPAGSQTNNFYAFASLWRTGDACSWANGGPGTNCTTRPCKPNGGSCSSAPANHGGLIASAANGFSWTDLGTSFDFCTITGGSQSSPTFGGFFVNSSQVGYCPSSFIQFGPGNTQVPASIGGGNYLYMFALNVLDQFNSRFNSLTPKHVYLMRAPAASIQTLSTWQYFTGLDVNGVPTWATYSSNTSYANIQPIYTDLNPIGTASTSSANNGIGCGGVGFDLKENIQDAVYNPALHRYIGSAQGNAIGQTSFFEAPQPWGPWSVVQYNNFDLTNLPSSGWGDFGVGPQTNACQAGVWQGSSGVALGVHFINAYSTTSSMQAIYSSDGIAPSTALSDVAGNYWDSFNAVTFHLTTNPPQ